MKPIIVQDQVRLGAMRCLQLALSGMGYRMFRSLITVSILSLAVAFLVHVLAHGMLEGHLTGLAYSRLAPSRALGRWVSRLTTADLPAQAVRNLAIGGDDRGAASAAERLGEYQRWSDASDAQMLQGREDAQAVRKLEVYLTGLTPTARAVLAADLDALMLARKLQTPRQMEEFRARLTQLKIGDIPDLDELVNARISRLLALLARIESGQLKAISQVRGAMGQGAQLEWIATSPQALEKAAGDAGFHVPEGELASLADPAGVQRDMELLGRMIESREVKNLVARQMGQPVALINQGAMLDWLTSTSRAQWLEQTIAKTGGKPMDPARMLAIAVAYQEQQQLEAALGDASVAVEPGQSIFDLPRSTLFLIGLSFLVCAVGVANAMLMSVTERFSEIATMKCLGAMDGFVMLMFVFEAAMQGLFGGLAGVFLGLLLALLRGLVEYGGLVFAASSLFLQLLIGGLIALVAGVILAVVAAVWPAWVASRLAPMEAMRVE
ncbi:MAG: ABC transporter permease [Phycisphaeraceae bacterium]